MKILDALWNRIWLKYYKVSVGANFKCEGRIILQGHGSYRLGDDVHIISKEFINPIDYQARIANVNSETKFLPVKIGKGAFVRVHTLILKGVTIGKHAVIGAGSVVTKNVPDNEVWAGNAA